MTADGSDSLKKTGNPKNFGHIENAELAFEVANLGLWTRDLVSGKETVNSVLPQMLDIQSRDPNDIRQIILSGAHPDDRVDFEDAIDHAINPDGSDEIDVSIRVMTPENTVRWLSMVGRVECEGQGDARKANKLVAVFTDITDQRETDSHNALLIGELNRRVKNILSIVHSVAYQTFRHDASTTGLFADFQGRLRALGKAHDLLVERRFLGTFLEPLADRILRSCGAPINRVKISGFPLHLGSKQAVSLSIILHELSVNALKYGAFSLPAGQVELSWTHNEQSDMVRLQWIETNGPVVIAPEQKGYGSRMIERAIALEFRGALTMDFAPEGVKCVMTIPFKSFDRTHDE